MNQNPNSQDQDGRYLDAARRFGSAIERLARGYEADSELRRDLIQEIHVALWRSYAHFNGKCSDRTWIYRIAHNVAVSHLIARRRLRRESLMTLDEISTVAENVDLEQDLAGRRALEKLLATIHALAPPDRQVMLLYLENLRAAEIGQVTGMSAGGVAVRIHRIKALLTKLHSSTGPFE